MWLIFNLGIKIILGITIIFFAVFYYLCFLWADGHTNRERFSIAMTLSFIYGFKVFLIGAVAVSALSLIWKYTPDIIQFLK